MKNMKEVRQLSRELLRSSFTDGQLDQGRIAAARELLDPEKAAQLRRGSGRLQAAAPPRDRETQRRHRKRDRAGARRRTEVLANLRRKYGIDLATQFVVNPELLGGMRIRVGSDVWDSSVRNRLQRLQQQL
jgi:F-type H+-transporting ATPase subunit delta